MSDRIYKIIEIVGSSSISIDDAIQNGIARAAKTIKDIGWFKVEDTRGHVIDGKVAHYQVVMKVGFTLHD